MKLQMQRSVDCYFIQLPTDHIDSIPPKHWIEQRDVQTCRSSKWHSMPPCLSIYTPNRNAKGKLRWRNDGEAVVPYRSH
jgi:hypothetical protein